MDKISNILGIESNSKVLFQIRLDGKLLILAENKESKYDWRGGPMPPYALYLLGPQGGFIGFTRMASHELTELKRLFSLVEEEI